MSELEKLNQEIRRCQKCPLVKTRKKAVPGEGPAKAKIMIIGQAPGREEDRQGRPFIGRAGKLLGELLEIAGIKRKKIFLTSPIKCFPPGNRKPTKKELQACLPYLKRQIGIIQPQKLILLGEVAFLTFFKGKYFKDYRGKWLKKQGREYFITYHPAAALRFPRIRKILEQDFKRLIHLGA